MIKHKKFKRVLIEWLDSKGITENWEYLYDLESLKPYKCISIGFLLEETEEYKTIVQTISPHDNPENTQILGRITIPNCSILKIKTIK